MQDPDDIEFRYTEARDDLGLLVKHAFSISKSIFGKEAPGNREYYASAIFSKLLSQCITLHSILPKALNYIPETGDELWDLSSACSIARSCIEAYDALYYISFDSDDTELVDFRIDIWNLHDHERRLKMLNFIGSKSPKVSELEEDCEILRRKILNSSLSHNLHNSVLGNIKAKNTPDYILPIKMRCERSNINLEYYSNAKMFLSSYVHTHPLSIHQLMNFKAGELESLRLLSLPSRYVTVFLSKAIEGMGTLFNSQLPAMDKKTQELVVLFVNFAHSGAPKLE